MWLDPEPTKTKDPNGNLPKKKKKLISETI